MSNQTVAFIVTLVLVAVLWTGSTTAQSSDCTNVIISMSPCLTYITGNSSMPESACCTQLGSVVKSKPECLCQVLNGGGSSLGLEVNQTQAEALPSACKVQSPALSTCKASSPNGSPASNGPSGSGSNKVPSTGNGSSDGNSIKLAAPLLFFFLFVASYASSFTI